MNFLKRKQRQKAPMIPFSEFSAGREKRMKPERKTVRSYLLVPFILWGLFLLALSYLLFFSGETMIADIDFTGNERISSTDIENIMRTDMRGEYFGVFPKNNFFFVPRGKILSDIRDFSPHVKSVRVERIFPNGLLVWIEERPIVIVWRSANEDFILDEEGVTQSHPNISSVLGSSTTIILYDEDGRETKSGDAVIDASIDASIVEYRRKFESRFGRTLSPEVHLLARFSGELVFHVEDGFDMMVDGHRPVDDTLSTLQATLDRGIPEMDQDHLSRVDLRTANKVYYTLDSEQGAGSSE
ncbi:MAG: FtsQ-type POTRA domain-containing protein [Candidatus Moraniibacteriota bacterium]